MVSTTTRSILAAVIALTVTTAAHAADVAPALYTAKAFVTGQGIENRATGFAAGFREVLAKVSGDPTLIDDPAVADMAGAAGEYVDGFSYRDRMADIPVHDEQGTRDRPFELTVTFAPDAIDGALAALGRKPWNGARPTVAVVLAVDHLALDYPLTQDGTAGREPRAALADAAERTGLTIVLPPESEAGGMVTALTDPATLASLAAAIGGQVALSGTLAWSDADLGWNADWRLDGSGPRQTWRVRGASLGDATRSGLRGAAQILSGNGVPD